MMSVKVAVVILWILLGVAVLTYLYLWWVLRELRHHDKA